MKWPPVRTDKWGKRGPTNEPTYPQEIPNIGNIQPKFARKYLGVSGKSSLESRRLTRYLAFVILSTLLLLPFMRFVSIGSDEGTLVYGAVRISQGQVFARDFFEVMGPGTFYWLASFFKVFGVTFFAARLCLFVTSLGTGLCVYYLADQVCPERRLLPCLILFATYFGAAWPGISHHVDSNFFALLSIVCVTFWHNRPNYEWLFLAGLSAGATALIHLPKGAFLSIAIALWLAAQGRSWRVLRPILGVAAGIFAVWIPFVLYFWSQGAIMPLLYANFIFPSTQYAEVNVVPYAQGLRGNYWDNWLHILGTGEYAVGFASILVTPFLFIATLPALFISLSAKFWRSWAVPKILLYWIAGSALWLSEFHRRDIYHLIFGSPVLIVLCVSLLHRMQARIGRPIFLALAVSSTCLICANLLIVALIARPFQTRVGLISVLKPDPIVMFLNEHAPPETEIFVYPYCPNYYFLTSTVNPTPYSFLLYRYNTSEQFRNAISILETRRPRYVIWDTNFNSKAAAEAFPGSQRINPDDLIVEPYLIGHYAEVQNISGVLILERKAQTSSIPKGPPHPATETRKSGIDRNRAFRVEQERTVRSNAL